MAAWNIVGVPPGSRTSYQRTPVLPPASTVWFVTNDSCAPVAVGQAIHQAIAQGVENLASELRNARGAARARRKDEGRVAELHRPGERAVARRREVDVELVDVERADDGIPPGHEVVGSSRGGFRPSRSDGNPPPSETMNETSSRPSASIAGAVECGARHARNAVAVERDEDVVAVGPDAELGVVAPAVRRAADRELVEVVGAGWIASLETAKHW